MSSDLNFNANDVKPNTRPDPIPNGEVTAAIVESEVTDIASGKRGKLLKLKLHVIEPAEYKGRLLFDQLCIQHESEKAQQIAQGQLSAICHATGVLQLRNSSQLHNIPMKVRIVVTQDAGYEPKNEIKAYKPLAGGPPAAVAGATPPAVPTGSTAAAPAWARKAG